MIGPLLALCSGLTWGVSDFMGGMISRRLPPAAVVGVSQACALVVLLLLLPWLPTPSGDGWIAWAVLAGLAGAGALVCFYRALSLGTVGVVSPISALGVIIPVLVGLFGGEQPGAIVLAGIVLALAGAVLASGPELRSGEPVKATAIWFALAAAAGFGVAMLAITRGAASSPLFTLLGMRGTSVLAFAIAALVLRQIGGVRAKDLPKLAVLGIIDVAANAMLGYASTMALLSVTAVLGALYPVVTVALAAIVLRERMKPVQVVGVVLAFAGVGLIAAG